MRTLIAAAALLAACISGCAIAPDLVNVRAEGVARQVPLLIYGTSWNSPKGQWNSRRMGDPIPPGGFYMEIMNTHSQDIDKIAVHVIRCGVKAGRYQGSWLMLQGPFKQGDGDKVVPVSVGMDVNELLPWNQVNHLVITEVRVEDAGGKSYDYSADVTKVLTSNISNFCDTKP